VEIQISFSFKRLADKRPRHHSLICRFSTFKGGGMKELSIGTIFKIYETILAQWPKGTLTLEERQLPNGNIVITHRSAEIGSLVIKIEADSNRTIKRILWPEPRLN
jgi:hypothetical protein